jgi:protoheme IX farnesyltransferase
MLGTTLAAFGANALNQCIESSRDRHMDRTCDRPLPSGRVSLRLAIAWALALLGAGVALLAATSNLLAAGLALLVGVLYVAAYTPLKPRTSLNTLIGAVCGAIPPMIGWAAASGSLAPAAWVLFGILFAWQIPHFLAIDWYHKDDYARGGFCMASSVDPTGQFNGHLAVLYCLALLPISIVAPLSGIGGPLYLVGALALGTAFLGLSLLLYVQRTREAARRLFFGSLAYLPLLLALLVLDPTRM